MSGEIDSWKQRLWRRENNMLFSSLTFLFVFLPLVLIVYFINKNRAYRNTVLLLFSLLFYSWGEPKYIFLMIIEITFTYFITLQIDKYLLTNKSKAKKYLILEIILVLGFLFFFKYYDFFIVNILKISSLSISVVLPIGISFYSFQILSYVIDVYRKEVKVQKNIFYLGTYVSLFPQLIAGPIVRYQTVADEITNRKETIDKFADGIRRFIIGLGKKIIIANHMAIVADKVFLAPNIADLSSFMCWLGAFSFMMQIYFDFSGYSDMAIGLGKMFGFHFLENFNFPYMSKSISDFWRRWHISLGSWFRDYVYIPLGGSRVSKSRWIFNICVVWALTGLWHGASWNFICWGIYYGVLLILEKLFFGKILEKLPILNIIIVNVFVFFGWVLFNSPSLSFCIEIITKMFSGFDGFSRINLNNFNILYLWPYYIIAIIGCFPISKLISKFGKKFEKYFVLYDVYLLIVFLLCIMYLINNTYNPFIYFRF